jgi:hypothetical protein
MKTKRLKIVLIIFACLLLVYLLIKLFFMPFYAPFQPDNIKEAKKANILIREYQIEIIDIFDFSYHFQGFNSVFFKGTLIYERNKLGIVRMVADTTNYNTICFELSKKDTVFNKDNCFKTWAYGETKYNDVFWHKFEHNSNDTLFYTIYLMNEYGKCKVENLKPVFNIKLVPKNQ